MSGTMAMKTARSRSFIGNEERVLRTRVVKSSDTRNWHQRIALFACASDKAAALKLLDELAEGIRESALSEARASIALSSADRQAQLGAEFGPCADAEEQIKELLQVARGDVRRAIIAQLQPYQRAAFSTLNDETVLSSPIEFPLRQAWSARLLRETQS